MDIQTKGGAAVAFLGRQGFGIVDDGERLVVVDRGESIERLMRVSRKHNSRVIEVIQKAADMVPYYRKFA